MERGGLLQNPASKSGAYWRRGFIRGGGGGGTIHLFPGSRKAM